MTRFMAEHFPEDVRAHEIRLRVVITDVSKQVQKRFVILCFREEPTRSTTGHDCVKFQGPVCQQMTAHGQGTTASADLFPFIPITSTFSSLERSRISHRRMVDKIRISH